MDSGCHDSTRANTLGNCLLGLDESRPHSLGDRDGASVRRRLCLSRLGALEHGPRADRPRGCDPTESIPTSKPVEGKPPATRGVYKADATHCPKRDRHVTREDRGGIEKPGDAGDQPWDQSAGCNHPELGSDPKQGRPDRNRRSVNVSGVRTDVQGGVETGFSGRYG